MPAEPNEKNTQLGRYVILIVTEGLNDAQARKLDENLEAFAQENKDTVNKISLSEFKGGVL